MSRIAYSDDEDYPGQFNLWQANCNRSLAGRAGQAVLRDLEAALLSLPQKRLLRHAVACDGQVCAVGAYLLLRKAQTKGVSIDEAQRELEAEMGPKDDQADIDTAELGEAAGMPRLVAWKLVALNDIVIDGHYEVAEGPLQYSWMYRGTAPAQLQVWVERTPEERYEKVLSFVRSKLQEPADVA